MNFDIETDWDYAYLIASTDGGTTWTNVHTNLSTNTDPNDQNFGEGITGTTDGEWVPLMADLVAFAGQADVLVGFRYWTDPFVNPIGFMVDEIMIGANGPFGAEDPAADGFTFVPPDGFHATTGLESSFVFNAYVLEYRQYNGYDASLKTGPYNFGFLDQPNRQNWVEHFPYQDGLLISYWNAQYDPGEVGGLDIDNNTSEHPGEGFLLPVDAHPVPMFNAEGDPWRARVQSYDSTFGTQRTERIELHVNSEVSVHPQQKAVPLFDDSKRYWNPASPLAGVKVPTHGVQIQTGDSGGFYMWVTLNP
jgi:immune inhibitor A